MTFSELLKLIGKSLRLWVSVAPWEQAARIRLGKHTKLLTAGFHLIIPLLDRIIKEKVTTRTSNIYCQTVQEDSSDRILVFKAIVRFRVEDLLVVCNHYASPEDIIIDTVSSQLAVNVSDGLGVRSAIEEIGNGILKGLVIESIRVSDVFSVARAYRLVNDKVTEYSWGDKVTLKESD